MKKGIEINEFRDRIGKYLQERNWHLLRPSDVAKSISIEAAELLEIFQWTHEELLHVKKSKERKAEIGKELADIMIYAFEMGTLLDLDLEKVLTDKLEKISKKYPAHLFKKQNPYTAGTDDLYWKIKNRHRAKHYTKKK